jgi:hypothetical protein
MTPIRQVRKWTEEGCFIIASARQRNNNIPYGQKIETAAGIEAVAKAPEFGRRVAERIFGS